MLEPNPPKMSHVRIFKRAINCGCQGGPRKAQRGEKAITIFFLNFHPVGQKLFN